MDRSPQAKSRRKGKHTRQPTDLNFNWVWAVIVLAIFGIAILLLMGILLLLGGAQTRSDGEVGRADATATPQPGGIPATSVNIEPWNGTERFTMLLMGMDRRAGETGFAYRTDTMILFSIDPQTGAVGMLSIPRDLYMDIPAYKGQQYGIQKVTTAFFLGELAAPGRGGGELAMQTIQYNLGIRVHDYVVIDFQAFIALVDAVGGVDIEVPFTINDPSYPDLAYGYDPFYLEAGIQQLDGYNALRYVRTRHQTDDFSRARRQQQLLMAIREKVLDLNMLPQLAVSAPAVWQSLSENMRTGLALDQIIRLAWYLKDIPFTRIKSGIIDEAHVRNWQNEDGQLVLIPDRATMGELMVEIFGPNYSD